MPWWTWLVALVTVAVVGSLAVALQRPGRARNVTAWLGATGFYVPLVAMFGTWARNAFAEGGSWGARIGFGFLATMFSIGLLVALYKTLAALRSEGAGDVSATH